MSLNELEFSSKINCFVGNNGVGKTNILDAIHYLSLTKSFFNNIDSISIRHGEDYFIIQGTFVRDGEEDQYLLCFSETEAKIVEKKREGISETFRSCREISCVMISPADSALDY